MLRRVFLCLFLVFWGGLGFSADIALDHALALIEEGRTTLDPSALDAARVEVVRLTQASPSNATYVYELARVDFYIVDSDTARHEKKPASEALELAIGEAQRAIALDGKFAEAHSLLGDLYGVKISLGGAFTGARYGPKIISENKIAEGLNPNSAVVCASLGRQYLLTPKIFGGDQEKALEYFRKATQLAPSNDENFVWLGIGLRKHGDAAGAEKAFQMALQLNPRSVFAKDSRAAK